MFRAKAAALLLQYRSKCPHRWFFVTGRCGGMMSPDKPTIF